MNKEKQWEIDMTAYWWYGYWFYRTLKVIVSDIHFIPYGIVVILMYGIIPPITADVFHFLAIFIPQDYERYLWWMLATMIYLQGKRIHQNSISDDVKQDIMLILQVFLYVSFLFGIFDYYVW